MELPFELELDESSTIRVEQVPYRNLPFRLFKISQGKEVASIEIDSAENPYERIQLCLLHDFVAVFLEQRGYLAVLDLATFSLVHEREIARYADVPHDFHIAKFHQVGNSAVLLETEQSLVAVYSDGTSREIAEHFYPRTVVRGLSEQEIRVQDGDTERIFQWNAEQSEG